MPLGLRGLCPAAEYTKCLGSPGGSSRFGFEMIVDVFITNDHFKAESLRHLHFFIMLRGMDFSFNEVTFLWPSKHHGTLFKSNECKYVVLDHRNVDTVFIHFRVFKISS